MWGGGWGLGFGLVRNHVWTELCLLITMSRMGYIKICLNSQCNCNISYGLSLGDYG